MRLQTRYVVTILALVLITGAMFAGIQLLEFRRTTTDLAAASARSMQRDLLAQLENRAVSMVEFLAGHLVTPIYQFDYARIHELVTATLGQSDVVSITVYDELGRMLDDGSGFIPAFELPSENRVPAEALGLAEIRTWTAEDAGTLTAAAPVMVGDRLIGGVSVVLSRERIDEDIMAARSALEALGAEAIGEALVTTMLAALAAALGAGVLSWMAARRLVEPVHVLARHTVEIGRGNYAARVGTDRGDELGDLARSFDEMADALAAERETSEQFRLSLEERSRDLEVARDQAEAASEAKSRFLATMSHEIRTPIHGVMGMTDLLRETTLDARQREYLSSIRRSNAALLSVIEDVLDFSKIEAGQLELCEAPFDLVRLRDDLEAMFRDAAARKGLELGFRMDAGLHRHFRGDLTRLRQVLTNLVGNAVKFTQSGGVSVTISGRPRDDSGQGGGDGAGDGSGSEVLRFEVTDTGIGIEEGDLEHIFDAFIQADGSTTRRFGGTGLGLSISRQLVELMGGEIGVESELWRGTTFWFTVPLQRAARVAAPAAPGSPAAFDAQVLLVEDNELNQLVAREALRSLGCTVDVAENGRAALDALRQRPYDIVIMDCHMPEMDGFAATRAIRRVEAKTGGHQVIVAATANALMGDRELCLEAGMDDYLTKPFSRESLAGTLALWLRAWQGGAQAAPTRSTSDPRGAEQAHAVEKRSSSA